MAHQGLWPPLTARALRAAAWGDGDGKNLQARAGRGLGKSGGQFLGQVVGCGQDKKEKVCTGIK